MKSSVPPLRLSVSIVSALLAFASAEAADRLADIEIRPPAPIQDGAFPLKARVPLPKAVPAIPPVGNDYRIMVKFHDRLSARVTADGRLSLRATKPSKELVAVLGKHVKALAPAVDPKLIQGLNNLQARAAARTKTAQPDLAGAIYCSPEDPDAVTLLDLAKALDALPEVEFVEIVAVDTEPQLPADLAPPTSDFEPEQTHLGSDPGLDGDYAHLFNAYGQGMTFIDVEYGLILGHEDLPESNFGWSMPSAPGSLTMAQIDHGTAVMTIVTSGHNGYGVSGLAPSAWSQMESIRIGSLNDALVRAFDRARAGDVVLYELATDVFDDGIPNADLALTNDSFVWMCTRVAADAGIVVIEAAGNGNIDLDTATVASLSAWRARGDSGSILVGAGSANTTHSRLPFSCYGSMVEVQAWGQSVVTGGYGDRFSAGGDKRQDYTSGFGGTSSASALVAGAATSLQSLAKAHLGRVLSPDELRDLLVATGTPQGGDTSTAIGPHVNMRAAIDRMIPVRPKFISYVGSYHEPFVAARFSSGRPMPGQGWVLKAEPDGGRVELVADRLRMDARRFGLFLNDATLHLNLSAVENVHLSFRHRHMNDEVQAMPARFEGVRKCDGVAFSADGVTWHKLTDFAGEPSNRWSDFEFNLSEAAARVGVTLDDNVRVRFQQFGTRSFGEDGREFDDIRVVAGGPGEFALSTRDDEVLEGRTALLRVSRSLGVLGAVSVDVDTVALSADESDYTALHTTLHFAAGDSVQVIEIPTTTDGVREGTELFDVVLSNPTGGATLRPGHEAEDIEIYESRVTGWDRFRDAGPFEIPEGLGDFLPPFPFPKEIKIERFRDRVIGVRVRIEGVNSANPGALGFALMTPDGKLVPLALGLSENKILRDATLRFGLGGLATPKIDLKGAVPQSNFLAPPFDADLGSLRNIDPNGSWQLVAWSDGGTDNNGDGLASIEGGWALSFVTAPLPEVVDLQHVPGEAMILTFASVLGGRYQVQAADELRDWATVIKINKATSTFTQVKCPLNGKGAEQFRVVELALPQPSPNGGE